MYTTSTLVDVSNVAFFDRQHCYCLFVYKSLDFLFLQREVPKNLTAKEIFDNFKYFPIWQVLTISKNTKGKNYT